MEKKQFIKCQLKSSFEEDNSNYIVKGYASVFDHVDLGMDKIKKGAFVKSLLMKLPVLLWQHNTNEPIGAVVEAREDDRGLFFVASMPKEDTFVTGRVIPQLKAKSINGVSIGYFVKDSDILENGVREIKEIELLEISLVTFPMNTLATVTDVKSVMPFNEELDFVRDSAGEIIFDYEWDKTKADKRVRLLTGSEDAPSEEYKKAFIWYDDSKPENYSSYKLPFVDVIENDLRIVPHALSAVVGALNGARGGVDIPEEDVAKAKSVVTKYYKKMGLDDPFTKSNNDTLTYKDIKDLASLSKFLRSKMTKKEADAVVYSSKQFFRCNDDNTDGVKSSDIETELKKLKKAIIGGYNG